MLGYDSVMPHSLLQRISGRSWCLLFILATIVVLHSFGQPWWCESGDLMPWTWDTVSRHNSQHFIDAYSFTHITHGLIFYALLHGVARSLPISLRLVIATVIECGWEVLENTPFIIERYRAATISLNYFGDSIANSVADIGCCMVGFYIALQLPWRVSLMLFLFIEAVLLVTIRDSLAINILMLISPIDAIREWQQGAPLGL